MRIVLFAFLYVCLSTISLHAQPDPNSPVNNNTGGIVNGGFTQTGTSALAFGNNILIVFTDAGSYAGGNNHSTGYVYSSDGGASFTDGGTLPVSVGGDLSFPRVARNKTSGRIYLSVLNFSGSALQVFRSDNNGVSWQSPVNGTPGGGPLEDVSSITVDNNSGAGNGNVYLASSRFNATVSLMGLYFFRSTDNGTTFIPNAGILLSSSGDRSKKVSPL